MINLIKIKNKHLYFISLFSLMLMNLSAQDNGLGDPRNNPADSKTTVSSPEVASSSELTTPAPEINETSDTTETDEKSASAEDVSVESDGEKTEDQIIDETVLVDIETSTYDELVFWCRRVALDYAGSKSDLSTRLKTLYGVSGVSGAKPKDGDKITIESAEKTDYYKIEEIDEDYIRIVGNVAVLLDEKKESDTITHKITADYIIFNKKQKLMTAYGNVLYEKVSGSSTDFFKGKSLVFNIKSWEGVIYQGVSEKEKKSETDSGESSSTFFYSGEKLIKGKDDKIKMINGKISSSEGDFPIYSISADSIWVLGPGEWAIRGATMRVGEVPLMYLPFFLKWGDNFVFNPAVGKSDDVGRYLNTTYYIMGTKKGKGSADSFNFMDPGSGTEDQKQYKDGLFLRNGDPLKDEKYQEKLRRRDEIRESLKIPKVTDNPDSPEGEGEGEEVQEGDPPEPKSGENSAEPDQKGKSPEPNNATQSNTKKKPENVIEEDQPSEAKVRYLQWKKELQADWDTVKSSEDNYLKLMVDAYSNIGQFVGIEGDLSNLGNFKKVYFQGGIGLSYFGSALTGADVETGMPIVKKTKFTTYDPESSDELNLANSFEYYGPVVDHSYFFGILVPFRYGMEAEVNYNNSAAYFNSTFKFELYSDSSYETHFLKYRQETFDFESSLGLTEDDPVYQDAQAKTKLNWQWTNNFNSLHSALSTEAKKYISSLSISKLNFGFQFQQQVFDDVLLNYYGAGDTVQTIKKEYFVPSEMTLPSFEFKMKGNLFNSSYSSFGKEKAKAVIKPGEDEEKNEVDGIRSPWENRKNDEEEQSSFNDELKSAEFFDDVSINRLDVANIFSHSLSYDIRSLALQLEGKFIDETPETPTIFHQLGKQTTFAKGNRSIINFQLSEVALNLAGDFNLSYNADFIDKMISVTDTLSFVSKYQKHFDSNTVIDNESTGENSPSGRDEAEEEKQSKQTFDLEDYNASNIKLKNSFSLSIDPFKFYEPLKGSSIKYSLSNTLIDYQFNDDINDYELKKALWDNANVDKHSLNLKLNFKVLDKSQSLSIDFYLPPKETIIKPRLSSNFGLMTNSLSFDIYKQFQDSLVLDNYDTVNAYSSDAHNLRDINLEDDFNNGLDSWYVKLINFDTNFKFDNGITVSNKMKYNPLNQSLETLSTNFGLSLLDNKLKFSQQLTVSETNNIIQPTKAMMSLDLWYFSIKFNAVQTRKLFFDWDTFGWEKDLSYSESQLLPDNLVFKFDYSYNSPPLWKNRIKFNFHVNTGVTYLFEKYLDSSLDFKFDFSVDIYDFLSISFNMFSTNKSLFLYSQSMIDKINTGNPGDDLEQISFFKDLFQSFGSTEQRQDSNFNLQSIGVDVKHHLGEWDLILHFDGSPNSFDPTSNVISNQATWKRNFSISIVWRAIDMIKTEIDMDTNDKLTF